MQMTLKNWGGSQNRGHFEKMGRSEKTGKPRDKCLTRDILSVDFSRKN